MKKSIELDLLIESVKVSLLGHPTNTIEALLKKEIDWHRLEKLAIFHAIRPVLSDTFQRIGFENSLSKELKTRTLTQSIFNLATNQELERLLDLLRKQGIDVLPYKGVLFISELYKNQQLRETHDLDLLVQPENAKKALEILLEDGYTLDIKNPEKHDNEKIINSIFENPGFMEVGLDKKTKLGVDIHIDFHWHIKEEAHDFKVNFNEFFSDEETAINKAHKKTFVSPKTLFTMLLIHHGGRECWTRLKHFCDLIEFLKTTNLNKHELNQIAIELGMKRFFETGMELYENEFRNIQTLNTELSTVKQDIIKYWEIGKLWLRLDHRVRFTSIYFKLLDEKKSFRNFLASNYRYFSNPNLIENPRLITFPNNYPFLNFISKIITFIWKKTIKNILKV
ncbi:hypothetical protein EGI26_06240 [Lacihabitans sp. CCS-44]|uniref:nucleotidyltransferase family protein n=1 Tax=Lacihabitans sp. CCS-44 TaxID=2487331 RepID=UPI0020CF9E5F|nr:nucleotidyltransferase family protein [Lacihabitans sp. CCS-44]MCP9754761.1 hypothetical protein [Lacihabitans sp. CCS-44]